MIITGYGSAAKKLLGLAGGDTAFTDSDVHEWHCRVRQKHASHKAYVVFERNTDVPILERFLRPGFQHCWVLIWDGARWISVDPLSNHIEVMTYNEIMDGMDLPAWLADRYTAVVEVPLRRDGHKELYVRWLSCVEIVKHYIGVKSFWVITPYNLFNHLLKTGGQRVLKTVEKSA